MTCVDVFLSSSPLEDGGVPGHEPPLTDVFTVQWFLTMFATCLPMGTVLRVWDTLLLHGSEVLFRVGLAVWSLLEKCVSSFVQFVLDSFFSDLRRVGLGTTELYRERIFLDKCRETKWREKALEMSDLEPYDTALYFSFGF